ncbi:hypothetical protein [Clostridium taeniosporum]|uniref:Uncharacterized protein n=1 Tax=Clostridium taeniosporum TaxID=394958 RepID=A0A1D7XK71_9CLOT|nr:hypothetical protein [Clostridium taeniosporum]AOR23570.1 hypothetical protein BGI42_07415 [Clostridium taeniosporum]
MNEYNFQQKDLIVKKLYEILGHARILENLKINTNLNDELSKRITIFKISLNDASKIILQYYIQGCVNEIMNECNKEDFFKFNNLIGKVLK